MPLDEPEVRILTIEPTNMNTILHFHTGALGWLLHLSRLVAITSIWCLMISYAIANNGVTIVSLSNSDLTVSNATTGFPTIEMRAAGNSFLQKGSVLKIQVGSEPVLVKFSVDNTYAVKFNSSAFSFWGTINANIFNYSGNAEVYSGCNTAWRNRIDITPGINASGRQQFFNQTTLQPGSQITYSFAIMATGVTLGPGNGDVANISIDTVLKMEFIDPNAPVKIVLQDANKKVTIAANDTAWITGEKRPKMPSLVAKLEGGTADQSVLWKFTCIYNRPRRPGLSQDNVELSKSMKGNETWNIYEDYKDLPFFGGDAVLSCKVGTDPEQTLKFKILGKNPSEKDIRDYIEKRRKKIAPDAWFAYAIPKIESRYKGAARGYNQFYDGESGVYKSKEGTVVFGPDPTGPGGYGLFQITVKNPLIPREQIWNWQENVDAGLKILNTKCKEADTRIASLRKMANSEVKTLALKEVSALAPQISFPRDKGDPLIMNGGDLNYKFPQKPNITFKDPGTPKITSPAAYPTIRDAHAMRRFNGGNFCYWIRGNKNKKGKLTSLGHWQFNGQRSWKNKDGTTHIDTKSYVNEVCKNLDSYAIDYPVPHVVAPPKVKN